MTSCSTMAEDDTALGDETVVPDGDFTTVHIQFRPEADHGILSHFNSVGLQIQQVNPAQEIGEVIS